MTRGSPQEENYDPLAADFNEMYGLYRVTLSSADMYCAGNATMTLRVHMKHHTEGVKIDYYDVLMAHVSNNYSNIDATYTFRSVNDIDKIEIRNSTSIPADYSVTIEKLRTTSVYDSTPMVVTTLTGLDSGQVISVSGLINVEAVPGAQLRIDLKPEDDLHDGSDAHAARNLRVLLRHYDGYDFLSTISRYEKVLDMVHRQ
jgi:hypothetical protein